jgi:hypothetical protein
MRDVAIAVNRGQRSTSLRRQRAEGTKEWGLALEQTGGATRVRLGEKGSCAVVSWVIPVAE